MQDKVERMSARMVWVVRAAMGLLPLGWLAVVGGGWDAPAQVLTRLGIPEVVVQAPPGPALWALILVLLALPLLAGLAVLWQVQALFALYSRGDTLSPAPAERIGRIGLWLLAVAVLSVAVRPLVVGLATLGNAPGERMIAVSLGSTDLVLALAAVLMVVIGHVMNEAARVAEENRAFV